jgi:hypothetical protein
MFRVSSFTYGDSTLTCTLPALPWTPAVETIGGWRDAASGTPASYVVRDDALLDLVVRVEEADWPAFANLLTYGRSAQSVIWTPDLDEDTTYEVYIVSPKPGERFAPSRSTGYQRVYEVTMTLRGKSTVVPWPTYFVDS